MQNTLVIKRAAAGDVVRTTSLLNQIHGNIYWLVDEKNKLLFPENYPGLHLLTDLDSAEKHLSPYEFDLVISLEEDEQCASLASSVRAKKIVGVLIEHGKLTYNQGAAGWFDMSLISKKGREMANNLKKTNSFPFQHWLFQMIGKTFRNEPYVIYRNPSINRIPGRVGIEERAGHTWPNKTWRKFSELIRMIANDGYEIKTFTHRENVRDYLDEIASCSCIISGDSLPMHVSMAYQIPCIAIFNCTPPKEIYDYDCLVKISSPLLEPSLYQLGYDERVANALSVERVYEAFNRLVLAK